LAASVATAIAEFRKAVARARLRAASRSGPPDCWSASRAAQVVPDTRPHQFEDYRNLNGHYDKIVSIEMFEAVGLDHYDDFFGACDRLLDRDGVMLLQTITVDDWRFREYRGAPNWISKYIFPGAELASIAEVLASLARTSRMSLYHAEQIGTHYARTLHDWRKRFHRHVDEEAAFLDRHIGDMQLMLTKHANRRVLYGEPWEARGSSAGFLDGVPDTAVQGVLEAAR